MSAERLLELAREKFRDDWTDADETLFRAIGNGEVAYFGDGDPAEADTWDANRAVQADRVVWLCTDRKAVKEVSHQGVQIKGARIEGRLDLNHTKIGFPLAIVNSAVREGITIQNAHLAALALNGSHSGPIKADGLWVDRGLFMRGGFRATGEVRLLVATIGGNLDCNKGHFSNPDGRALNADGMKVAGSVIWRDGFQATGEVRLLGATIGANLECGKGTFNNPKGKALYADGAEIKGSVYLRDGFRAEGEVDFTAATVKGYFIWRDVEGADKCSLRLTSARIGTLWDEEKSWPRKLYLDGLIYDRIDNDAPHGADARLKWLERQGYDKFTPQPYVQLASVLSEMGHKVDARRILIAKQKDPARVKGLSIERRAWHYLLGWTIGHGYRPFLALIGALLLFIVLGSVLFGIGDHQGQLAVTKEGTVPAINAIVYSLDTFVPLFDLHQEEYWLPTVAWLRVYHWIHIGLGWVVISLLGLALTAFGAEIIGRRND